MTYLKDNDKLESYLNDLELLRLSQINSGSIERINFVINPRSGFYVKHRILRDSINTLQLFLNTTNYDFGGRHIRIYLYEYLIKFSWEYKSLEYMLRFGTEGKFYFFIEGMHDDIEESRDINYIINKLKINK